MIVCKLLTANGYVCKVQNAQLHGCILKHINGKFGENNADNI